MEESEIGAQLVEAGVTYRDREKNPDPRRSTPRYAVEINKGFQAPFVLGEGDTPGEAFEKAKETWRNRPEPRKPSYEELETTAQTWQHIDLIRKYLRIVAVELLTRGETHDRSKLDRAEVDVFTEYTPKLKGVTYGSDEYKSFLVGMKPALDHHYQHNLHHPEFHTSREEWRDVVDFEGIYEVSSLGNVRSVDREVPRKGKRGNLQVKGRMLNQYVTPKGYCRLQLQDGDRRKNYMVHRLVALAFIPNENGRPEVNHKDGNKKNNKIRNLEWVTPSENQQHAYEAELKQPNLKYVVECEELDLVTLGCEKMAKALWERGYEKATSGGIWRCINYGGTHLDLHFTGTAFDRWENGPMSSMSLLDLLEMMCDWVASTKRHADGNIYHSIEINQRRFGYDDELASLFRNTAKALGEEP